MNPDRAVGSGSKQVVEGWKKRVKTGTGIASLTGYLSILLFGGVFAVWAFGAPLSGAAIAHGIVAAAGQNQTIQHYEGGILQTVHVSEGQRVSTGEKLFELDATRGRIQLNMLTKQWIALRARALRLSAQRDLLDRLVFPDELAQTANTYGLDGFLEEQEREFSSHLSRHRSETLILSQRVQSGEEAITGLQNQKEALEEHLKVVRGEADRKKGLLDKGLAKRSEYTLLLRSQADLIGRIAAVVSQIAQSRIAISEAEEQLVRQRIVGIQEAITELNEINTAITNIEEQIDAAQDVLSRLVVRSPADGLIVRIFQNTPGSVVPPGGELATVLPTSSRLLVEARLKPADVDAVSLGQDARLRFLALNTRRTPEVDGRVTYLSADRLVDEGTRESYYVIRLSIPDELPEAIEQETIYPGMPVEAMISTGSRTFIEYLLRPLQDSFNRAFREE